MLRLKVITNLDGSLEVNGAFSDGFGLCITETQSSSSTISRTIKDVSAFRVDYEQFRKLDAEVLEMSSDSKVTHTLFLHKARATPSPCSATRGDGQETLQVAQHL
jgi:hypothetical protein